MKSRIASLFRFPGEWNSDRGFGTDPGRRGNGSSPRGCLASQARSSWPWHFRPRSMHSGPRTLIGKSIDYFDTERGRIPGGPSAAAPLGILRITGAKLVDQGRTVLLATDPHPRVGSL